MSDFYLELGKHEYHNVYDFVQDYWDGKFNLDDIKERFLLITVIEYCIVKGKVNDEILRLMEKMDYFNTAVDKNVVEFDLYKCWQTVEYIFEIDEFYALQVDESPYQKRTMAWGFTQPCKVRKKTIEKIAWEEIE